MIANVVTDIKTLKTKNLWHLLFSLIYFLIGGLILKKGFAVLLALFLAFGLGLLLSKIPHVTLGVGDIKMLMVIAMYEQVVRVDQNPVYLVIVLFLTYIVVSFIHMSIFKFVSLFKKGITFYSYKIEKGVITTPEAVPIFLTVITLSFLGG
ncbi:hypothetical protein G3M81_22985 [Bacillus paralicheniformis]|uniref:hypothetical protein n=1 Tax=Bacillus paralicheniformis TaxID=1648923 RepID=UPI0013EF1485|nr:hypothetical protein [Bacillus paralicheniformis]QII51425.1 hypothetical protein G3M81_22985 [Bacillus paralicheniformis]